MKNLLLAIMLPLCCSTSAKAQTDSLQVTQRTWSLGAGETQVLDTYLSEEHFSGTGITLMGSYSQWRKGSPWMNVWQHQAHFSSLADRAGNESMLEGAYDLYVGRMRRWNLCDSRLAVSAGAMVNTGLGFIYAMRNSNNPAQGRLHLALMPAVRAEYYFRLFRRPMSLGYEAQVPLVGVMFSPRFGQSYYEIFGRGNYDRNIVMTTFVSAPTFRQQLSFDADISPSFTLRLGLLADLQQAQVNDLKQHVYSYRFLLGVTKRFTMLRHRSDTPSTPH